MSQQALFALLTAIIISSLGLWWFRLVLPGLRKLPKTTRYGDYAAVWLTYFILSMILIKNAG